MSKLWDAVQNGADPIGGVSADGRGAQRLLMPIRYGI